VSSATFEFSSLIPKCPLCREELADIDTLQVMVTEAVQVYGKLDFLAYYGEGKKILIINNYSSLRIALADFIESKAVGVDLEGRLGKGGNINLL
jgi:hypothetical protein